jgi:hypothetical protein
MKQWILGVALLAACSDTQNLGDRFTFRSPRWDLNITSDGGGTSAEFATIDGHGDVVAAGHFTYLVNFGTTTLDVANTPTYWIGKRSGVDGSEKWTITLPMPTDSAGNPTPTTVIWNLAADADGNVFVAGQFSGTQDFGGQSLYSGNMDTFVAKYDADGHLVWVSRLGGNSGSQGLSIAVAPTGQIYVPVHQNGWFDAPQGRITAKDLIVSFDAGGTMLWAREVPALMHVAATNDGGCMFATGIDTTTTIGGTKIDLTRDGDLVVAKLDPAGNYEWVHAVGEPGQSHRTTVVAVDSADRAAVASGPDTTTDHAIEALVDASGVVWSGQPVAGDIAPRAITTYQDIVLTTGSPSIPIDFGNGPMIGMFYVAARDANGALVDGKVFGDQTLGASGISALATGPSGEVMFAGTLAQPIDFGTGTLGTTASPDHPSLVLGILDTP